MPYASLSLDLDNKWSYLKTHGDPQWSTYPTYLPFVVPRILAMLARKRLTITFFIVGRDAADPANADVLRAIADAGHEIGNHSYEHEPWLHRYSDERVDAEIANAEDAIARATGMQPRGFRGPGYSLSDATLAVLARRGYLYDASTLPTFIGPLARAYYFATSRMSIAERRERAALFGSVADALLPLRPYRWSTPNGALLEIPVTTLPFVRSPIHFSYQLMLAQHSEAAARTYFDLALAMCERTKTAPSLLLHPLDFLGADDDAELAFFPGMALGAERKCGLLEDFLDRVAARFTVVTMRDHAAAAIAGGNLTERRPHVHVPATA
jgi:hypothetical protein